MKLVFSILLGAGLLTTGLYSYSVNGVGNSTIDFNNFRGKKILIVNIATSSPHTGQLAELEQLYQLYKDSLVIIVFPSNSFGNEPRSNIEIQQFCSQNYHVSFLIASKEDVKGAHIQPVFKWLTKQSENGTLEGEVKNDFQKYIINRSGEIIGVFAGQTSPFHPGIIEAITQN